MRHIDSATARRDALGILFCLALLIAWDASGADLTVVRWFGNSHGFIWRDHWLFARVFHDGGRWLSGLAVGVVLVNAVRPWGFAREMPLPNRLWWCVATLVCLLMIPTLKHSSATSCPWDLTEFGGASHHVFYVSHWALHLTDGGPGRCFPSGHASAAFSLFSGWFVLRSTTPKAAQRWLACVWICGLAFSIGQLVRGAHYASHSMWTAWLCWTASAALWHVSGPLLAWGKPRAEVVAGG